MPYLVHEGVRLNYRDAGQRGAAGVVLLHGLAANQAFWNLELVGQLAADWRVITYDLRGHGYSDTPADGYEPEAQARDLVALLDHLELPAAHLVGHSFGGLIALQAAIDSAPRVRSLVLADSRLAGLAPEQILPQQFDWRDLQRRLRRSGVRLAEHEAEIGLCLLEAIAGPRWLGVRQKARGQVKFLPFAASKRSGEQWLKLLQATQADRGFRDRGQVLPTTIAALDIPLLAVYGERSPHRASMQALAHWGRHVRCETVADGGHFHPAAEPLRFAAIVRAFLGEVATISPGAAEHA
ncbi:MAG: alpha/beta hydrolase [Pirellulales bacterium]|nr:alpha/beta hydrolase [Pirellulales bacterium]